MATYIIDPQDVISDFLRHQLVDPRARAEASQADSTTATGGQTQIVLTAPSGKVSAITSVTINAATSSKWQNYHWDYQTQTVTFFTALSLNDAVIVTYKYGTSNWIYSDKPAGTISANNFPRISIFTVSNIGERMGQYQAPVESSSIFQIDIWCKDRYPYTLSGRTYTGEYLVRYIGNQITKAFEDNESLLFPVLYAYRMVSGVKAAPYSLEYTSYHGVVEINLKGLKTGRLEV